MGSANVMPKNKIARILEPQVLSIAVNSKSTNNGELEEIISHLKEQEMRRKDRLTSVALRNFGRVLENGQKTQSSNSPFLAEKINKNNISIQTSDKSNGMNPDFNHSPQMFSVTVQN